MKTNTIIATIVSEYNRLSRLEMLNNASGDILGGHLAHAKKIECERLLDLVSIQLPVYPVITTGYGTIDGLAYQTMDVE